MYSRFVFCEKINDVLCVSISRAAQLNKTCLRQSPTDFYKVQIL